MKTKHTILTLALMFGLLTQTGCVMVKRTRYNEPERTKVSFATDKAAHAFYETLSLSTSGKSRDENQTLVVLLVFNVDHRVIDGPGKKFNDAVLFCDTDKDGVITDAEAEVFAQAWPRFNKKP